MKFDQHFMTDRDLICKIVDYLEIKENEDIVEIGGGKGALTEELIKKTGKITVIEIDIKLYQYLKDKFPDFDIINDNILHFYRLEYDKIVGNLPYSIIEGLMRILINSDFKLAVFSVPKDFMNVKLLGLLMNIFFEIERLDIIPRKAFNPMPKVTSEIIRIKLRNLNEKESIIKKIYLQSDKKLRNAIRDTHRQLYSLSKKHGEEKIPKLNFLNKKVYALNFEEWRELIDAVAGI